jgi:hypothetical protein
MATMYPQELGPTIKKPGGGSSPTPGERDLFEFFKSAAKPDSEWVVWFEPLLGPQRLETDFLLFHKQVGFIIVEVKDWSINNIEEANTHHFKLRGQGRRANPEKQVRSYVYALQTQLKEMGFINDEGVEEGRHNIPIATVIAFPNVKRSDYNSKSGFKLNDVIPDKLMLLADDIDAMGDLAGDESGELLKKRFRALTPFSCPKLELSELSRLYDGIWPSRGTKLPARKGVGPEEFQANIAALDNSQARVARKLGKGHQILLGAPGTGKSLVLAHRCRYLKQYDSGVKRILVVCFNIAASRYLRRLIQEQGVGMGPDGVEVLHFFELCSRIMDLAVEYEGEQSDYYDYVLAEALSVSQDGDSKIQSYDAIMVDEGQDLSDDMYRLLLSTLVPGGDLLIALDSNQNIYRRRSTWKSLGINAVGNSHTLQVPYRNTVEIHDFAEAFTGNPTGLAAQPELLPEASSRHGMQPRLEHCESYELLLDFLTDEIQRQIENKEYKRSEIAIIYDDKTYAEADVEGPVQFEYSKKENVRQIYERLEAAGIPTKWVSEDARAKELYDITTDRVTLVSIHSAKGLDFDLVYLLGGNQIAPSGTLSSAELNLFYVGITRAKHQLVIPYCCESEFIARARHFLPRY